MMLWILVPLIALTGFWYALWRMSARSRAECFLLSLLGAAFFVAGSTEVLSLFGRIDPVSIRALWSAAALVTVCAAVVVWLRPARPRLPDVTGSVSWVEAGSMALIALTTGLIAIVSPPNNVDSLTYHMPRIMHWMQ